MEREAGIEPATCLRKVAQHIEIMQTQARVVLSTKSDKNLTDSKHVFSCHYANLAIFAYMKRISHL